MRKRLTAALAALLCLASCGTNEDYSAYVNPNIGTVHSR